MSFRLERLAHGSQCVHRNANWFVRVNHSVRSHLRLHRFRFVRVICKGIDYLLRQVYVLKRGRCPLCLLHSSLLHQSNPPTPLRLLPLPNRAVCRYTPLESHTVTPLLTSLCFSAPGVPSSFFPLSLLYLRLPLLHFVAQPLNLVSTAVNTADSVPR